MTSDLKPRRNPTQKKVNIKFYAALSLLILVTYIFFMSASSESTSSSAAADLLAKSTSAASQITKGIAGTHKDKSKTENQATPKDKETHALVEGLKKHTEIEPPTTERVGASFTDKIQDVAVATKKKVESATEDIAEKVPGAVNQLKESTQKALKPDHKDVPTHKSKTKTAAYDAEDSLNVLIESYDFIIFSKSFCPHSRAAKEVLAKYDIRPKPLIYELDVEDHGLELQQVLHKRTGRMTVPNILVHGTSLGGGDEIIALDKSGKLIEKVRGLTDATDISKLK